VALVNGYGFWYHHLKIIKTENSYFTYITGLVLCETLQQLKLDWFGGIL